MGFIAFVTPVTIATLLSASILCLTHGRSLWRVAAVPIILCMSYQACQALDFFDDNQLFNPMQAGFVMAFTIHHIVVLCLERIDDGDIRREISLVTQQLKEDISWRQRFTWTLYLLTTLRGVDTSYEIKGLEKPSPQSRLRFFAWNLLVVVVQYLILDFFTSQPLSEADKDRLFAPGREYLIFRPKHLPPPTVEEVLVHVGIALMCWGPMGRWFIDVQYRITALLSVSLGVSRPEQWPPMFGSIFETYTLRRFWGRSWQQLFRWCFTRIGAALCNDVLRLPPRSAVSRYMSTIAIFAISAFLHSGMDAKSGIGLDKTGTITCFMLQPVGIMLEDTVQEIFYRFGGKPKKGSEQPRWHRLVGFIWVWMFLSLVAPIYNIPLFRYQDASKARVPFPVISRFLPAAWDAGGV